MARHKTTLEYLEVLERFDMPLEVSFDRKDFDKWVRDTFEKFAPKDTEAFWQTNLFRWTELAPKGITPVLVRYPWGEQLRFGVKGKPGLWGADKIAEMFGIKWE